MPDTGEVNIPIGPQHPSLKEPESFLLTLRGERITAINIKIGYNHRGIEKACEERTYIQDIYLVERVCGICSHSHSTCFVQAVEEIAGIKAPPRAQYIRTLVAELERIHSHLLWLGVAAHEIGFDTLLMYAWRDREVVMNLLASLTGNRVNYAINTIGGVRRDVSAAILEEAAKAADILEERIKYYVEVAHDETTVVKRLSGVGKLSREDAVRLGAVGPTGRASGINHDVRADDPYAAYADLEFKTAVDDHCDVYGRTLVRLAELLESVKLIRQVVKKMPDGPIVIKAPRRIPAGEAVSRYEAPRGEDLHYVRANGTDKPDRVKFRPPTLANIQAVARMLEDRYLADLPIVVAAIDPCFSCTDRMISLEGSGRDKAVLTWEQMRLLGIEHYRKQGVDFSGLNKKLAVKFQAQGSC